MGNDPFAVPSWVTDPAQIERAALIKRLAAGEQIPGWEWSPAHTRYIGGDSELYEDVPASAVYQGREYRPGGFEVANQTLDLKELAKLAAIMGTAYLGGLGLEGALGGGSAAAGSAGAGAGGAGTAGAGGAGAAGAGGAGAGGLGSLASTAADLGITSGGLTPAAIEAGLGTAGYGYNAGAAASGLFNPATIGAGAGLTFGGVPSWLANAGTTALNAFQKNPLGMIAAGASLLGGDALGGGGDGGGGANTPVNMALRAERERLPQPEYKPYSGEAVMGWQYFTPVKYAAEGGIMDLAKGGRALPPRYLRGETDGMADKIPSSIDGRQPAKLSHGEFVIPADVVSHLGNGNSDAGAKVLYKMMDRVRQARTGNKKQGKQIKPEKFMPGGIAGYNSGGAVAFNVGGPALPGTGDLGATQSSTLSPWAAPYVTNMLSQGQALGNMPYQAYTGPLTAGTSPLQQTAFQGAQGLGGTFDTAAAQQYMSPYIQAALQPQLAELRRQSDINATNIGAKFGGAGGGPSAWGTRKDIMESENLRNLGQQMERVTGQAYQSAFDKAMQQFNTQQAQNIANVQAQASLGGQQRDVEQQGIVAMQKQFEQERDYPYQQLSFQQGLLRNLPISTQTTSPLTSGIGSVLGDVAGAASIYKLIGELFPG